MAFKKIFTDLAGTTHENSFWYPVNFGVNYKNKTLVISYNGFKDRETHDNGFLALPGALHEYVIRDDKFNYWLDLASKGTEPNLVLALATLLDDIALSVEDVRVDDNNDDVQEFASFFADAERLAPQF